MGGHEHAGPPPGRQQVAEAAHRGWPGAAVQEQERPLAIALGEAQRDADPVEVDAALGVGGLPADGGRRDDHAFGTFSRGRHVLSARLAPSAPEHERTADRGIGTTTLAARRVGRLPAQPSGGRATGDGRDRCRSRHPRPAPGGGRGKGRRGRLVVHVAGAGSRHHPVGAGPGSARPRAAARPGRTRAPLPPGGRGGTDQPGAGGRPAGRRHDCDGRRARPAPGLPARPPVRRVGPQPARGAHPPRPAGQATGSTNPLRWLFEGEQEWAGLESAWEATAYANLLDSAELMRAASTNPLSPSWSTTCRAAAKRSGLGGPATTSTSWSRRSRRCAIRGWGCCGSGSCRPGWNIGPSFACGSSSRTTRRPGGRWPAAIVASGTPRSSWGAPGPSRGDHRAALDIHHPVGWYVDG